MVVGIDVTVRPHDEARAFALDRLQDRGDSAEGLFIRGSWKKRSSSVGFSFPSFFFVTSMMTTLGATISKTFVKALFSWWTTSFPASAAAGGNVGVGPASGWASGGAA